MKIKTKQCKNCTSRYPVEAWHQPFQNWCGIDCGISLSRKKQDAARIRAKARLDKQARQQLRVRREALKTKSDWTKEAQQAINSYVRARDKGRPCVSCGQSEQDRFTGGHFDCGHYRPISVAAHLRFDLRNMAGQCKLCNRDRSGNVVEYRKGLIERIGEEAVLDLEYDNRLRKFDIEYLKRIKRIFMKRTRRKLARD